MTTIDTVVFDIGNVLISWDPRWLFRQLLEDDAAIAHFFSEVDFFAWNEQHDAGQLFAQGIADHSARFPHHAHLFQAFFDRWEETLGPAIEGNVRLARRLRSTGYRTLALTNFSTETFPHALRRHAFLTEFEGILVSGREQLLKPDPAIYRLLCARHQVTPARAVFIDDSLKNVEGARQIGMHAIHFQSVEQLSADLRQLGVRVDAPLARPDAGTP